jgi:DNA-directed RNA polymerase specialized sigma24 family protein
MPPRRQRAGARAGSLSRSLRDALEAEAKRLRELPDPVDTIKGVGDAFAAMDVELGRLADVRLEAVNSLRDEGWSYDQIAMSTGLSKGRVAQLVWELRRRRDEGSGS